jgi:hypothetical protein
MPAKPQSTRRTNSISPLSDTSALALLPRATRAKAKLCRAMDYLQAEKTLGTRAPYTFFSRLNRTQGSVCSKAISLTESKLNSTAERLHFLIHQTDNPSRVIPVAILTCWYRRCKQGICASGRTSRRVCRNVMARGKNRAEYSCFGDDKMSYFASSLIYSR